MDRDGHFGCLDACTGARQNSHPKDERQTDLFLQADLQSPDDIDWYDSQSEIKERPVACCEKILSVASCPVMLSNLLAMTTFQVLIGFKFRHEPVPLASMLLFHTACTGEHCA